MTREQFNIIVKRVGNKNDDILYKDIIDFFSTGGFATIEHKAHFMSQNCHESNYLTRFVENLNYSANRLLQIFPKYFSSVTAKQYARKPVQIANKVYANRMENGDEKSGDGWRFRGASLIQLTGRKNFRLCSTYLKIDLINNPDFAQTIECAIPICDYYWTTNNLNQIISNLPKDDDINLVNNVKEITKRINGGTNGLNERIELYKKCKSILSL
jgi:putative chitinase